MDANSARESHAWAGEPTLRMNDVTAEHIAGSLSTQAKPVYPPQLLSWIKKRPPDTEGEVKEKSELKVMWSS